jgi:hypothetical protein
VAEPEPPYYGSARIRLATVLIIVVSALSLIDAFSERFELGTVQLFLFIGGAAALLGVEAIIRRTPL